MRSIHADYCNRNHFHNEQIFIGLTSCTMIYFQKYPLQTKCFRIVPSERYHVKEVFQTKYSSWIGNLKAKKRNSYKRLISFASTLSTSCCSIHEFLQANLWMGAFLTNTMSSRHCRLMNIFFWRTPFCFWWFTINQIRLNFCYEIFFCFERRLKWPIWFWNHKIISKRVGCEKFHTSNLNVNDTANYAKNTFISLWTKTKSTDLLMEK